MSKGPPTAQNGQQFPSNLWWQLSENKEILLSDLTVIQIQFFKSNINCVVALWATILMFGRKFRNILTPRNHPVPI